jgi:hypothetical protein
MKSEKAQERTQDIKENVLISGATNAFEKAEFSKLPLE